MQVARPEPGLGIYQIYRIECQDMAFESNVTPEDSTRIEYTPYKLFPVNISPHLALLAPR